jgi:hypothetical protein
MKCSVGVALCAAVVLLLSVLTLAAGAGAAYMFLGPISSQLYDPATLPPGADIRTMRAFGIGGAMLFGLMGGFGLATGIGLIRLWRWARLAVIGISGCVAAMCVLSATLAFFLPLPNPNAGGAPPSFENVVRIGMVTFYVIWAAVCGGFIVYFMRARTVAQFTHGVADVTQRTRPLSITLIGWLLIVSGALMVPSLMLINLPAMMLGLFFTGVAAKVFYSAYTLAYLIVGVGLLRQTPRWLIPAIAMHVVAVVNSALMLLPATWSRYNDVLRLTSPTLASQPLAPGLRFASVASGLVFSGVLLFLLIRAQRRASALAL